MGSNLRFGNASLQHSFLNLQTAPEAVSGIEMKSCKSVVVIALLVHAAFLAAETRQQKQGLIVESIAAESAAAHAGIQIGDRLLSWNQGTLSGPIDSLFDIFQIEVEQTPRGPVTLVGIRNQEEKT